jgi:hypothetical protein
MLEQAKTTTLQSTARAAGRTVINAGPIRLPPPNQIFFAPIEGYDPGFESQDRFMRDVFGLLNSETHDSSGVPVGVVEMPESGKVAVVTITEGTTPFPVDRADIVRSAIANSVRHDAETTLQTDWFSYTNVAKRIGYKPLHESEEERPEEVAQK